MIRTPPPDERTRLSSASSLADIVARQVTDLAPLPIAAVSPDQSRVLDLPVGWLLAAAGDSADHPVRVVVTGHRSRGGWEGCETLAAFSFTGPAPIDTVIGSAACTLYDLNASGITRQTLATAELSDACAVRASGYLTALGLRIWAQFSTYLAGSNEVGCGRLIQHSLLVTTQRRTQLRTDIAVLSDTIHRAFCAMIDTRS